MSNLTPYGTRIVMDEPRYHTDGKLWNHLTAHSVEELHKFAALIGLQIKWFQDKPGHPHYDICSKVIRNRAERLGATIVSRKYFSEYLKHHYGKQSSDIS